MKKVISILLVVLLMAAVFTACGSKDAAPAPASNAPAASDSGSGTIKIGGIGPTTGAAAVYGTAVKNGAQIAVDEINAMGGLQIEYKFQDDEHDAEKSVNAYNALKDWGVQMICGTVTTTPCIAVAAEANSDRVFMLTPSASSPLVNHGENGAYDYDNVFQLCFTDPDQGLASAQYIVDHDLGKKVAIIYNNADAYSTGIYQTFKAKAAELNLEVVSTTTFTDDTTDFSVQVADAQSNGADVVFLPIYYEPAALILRQAKSIGYAPVFFGVDGMDGILTLEGFDTSLAEGVMLLTPFSADAKDERTASFVKKYTEAFGETPNQFAADGYDVIYALWNAAKAAGINDKTSAADACEKLIATFSGGSFSVDGVTGAGMKWSKEGTVTKAPKAVVIQNGVYVGF